LSCASKSNESNAFANECVLGKIEFGVDFFFPVDDIHVTSRAFETTAPCEQDDENTFHHPYFLRELTTLVRDATAAGILIQQRVHWSKSGHWMSLDEGKTGVEPDFCTTDAEGEEELVANPVHGANQPFSKYHVALSRPKSESC